MPIDFRCNFITLGASATLGAKLIQAKILNIASNNCIPAITPKVSVVKYGNVDIVVVQVKKDNKVISDNNKKLWIRKGNISTNPDTREIEDLFNSCKLQS